MGLRNAKPSLPLALQEATILKEEKTQHITSPYPTAHQFLTSPVHRLPRGTREQEYRQGGVFYIIILPSMQTLRSLREIKFFPVMFNLSPHTPWL